MLRYPSTTSGQQAILAPLIAIVQQVPACELWITFLAETEIVYDSLSTGALNNLSNMASVLANVFDYLYAASVQSIYSSQYLLNLSISARQVASSASLYAQLSNGIINLTLTQAAQTALATLLVWDPVQGYQTPANPGALATTLIGGASLK